jgi:hypothetical protein
MKHRSVIISLFIVLSLLGFSQNYHIIEYEGMPKKLKIFWQEFVNSLQQHDTITLIALSLPKVTCAYCNATKSINYSENNDKDLDINKSVDSLTNKKIFIPVEIFLHDDFKKRFDSIAIATLSRHTKLYIFSCSIQLQCDQDIPDFIIPFLDDQRNNTFYDIYYEFYPRKSKEKQQYFFGILETKFGLRFYGLY